MVKATLNGITLAESDTYEIVEGNVYFPMSSLNKDYFAESTLHTTCSWKGVASYYDVVVGDTRVSNAAWYYPQTKSAAKKIENYVAFYSHKVQVER